MIQLIAGIVALLALVGKWAYENFSAEAKRKKKAVEDGKTSVDDNDVSGITHAFDEIRKD